MAPRDVVYNANKFSLLYLSSLMYEYLLLGPCLLKVVEVVKFQDLFDFLNLTVNDVFVLAIWLYNKTIERSRNSFEGLHFAPVLIQT